MKAFVAETCVRMERWLRAYRNPVVLWSGGKDSTAMLHLLVKVLGVKLPVVQWREPRFRQRYAFADRLAAEWDLEVYDWVPSAYYITDGPDIETGRVRFDFVKLYQIGAANTLAMCLGTEEPSARELETGRWHCGLDLLRRPTGNFNFPWDAAFHGQKSADVDLIKGEVPLAQDELVQAGVPAMLYPMRYWSDRDVWEYLEAAGVPNDDSRYEKVDGVWGHKRDKSGNADYYPVCWACVNRHNGPVVWCPKNLCEKTNVSRLAPYLDLTSREQGFRPTWGRSMTVNGVGHVAHTSGVGRCCDEIEVMREESQGSCNGRITR